MKKIPKAEMKPLESDIIAGAFSFFFEHPENMEDFKKWEREQEAKDHSTKCADSVESGGM